MSKIKFGAIGLLFVVSYPLLDLAASAVITQRIESSNQVFREKFGEGSVGLEGTQSPFLSLESEPTTLENIQGEFFYWTTWYISPTGGFLFGILSLFKDKKFGKILGILSILGALYIVFANLVSMGIYRMV